MAKVPLRVYNTEIENLIDHGQIEEAIAHCKYILQTFPKHLETYRVLSKAFLEGQHYNEAIDIFQRILSAVPDDFVSHVGMSIIREDEGDIDAAIWHMEHAFEVQPSNSLVQDELKRLYERRDGIEPPKIRLTRGALARLYARGDQYHQAIAEIRAVLAETPQRPDLKALLARMCFKAGQKVEATEICSELLAKYPYCQEANRILSEILPGTTRAEDAKIYLQRIQALDPYLAFTNPDNLDSADVPDNFISLEHLELQAIPTGSSVEPIWSSSLGLSAHPAFSQEEALPNWFTSSMGITQGEEVPEEMPSAAKTQLPDALPEKPVHQIPDWMVEAGWQETTENAEQPQPQNESISSEPESKLEIPQAEIPDWLNEMAPGKDNLPNPAEEETFVNLINTNAPSDQALPSEPPSFIQPKNNLLDWLNSFQEPVTSDGATATSDQASERLHSVTEPEAIDAGDTKPAFEKSPESETLIVQRSTSLPVTPPVEQPYEGPIPVSNIASDKLGQSEEDAALAWLESLAGKHGADEELLFVKPEDRREQPPEWVQEATVRGDVEAPPPQDVLADSFSPVEEIPEWLQDAQAPVVPAIFEEQGAISVPETEGQPPPEAATKWLEEETQVVQKPFIPSDRKEYTDLPTMASRKIPVWLNELGSESPVPTPVKESTTPLVDAALIQPAEEIPEWLQEIVGAPAASQSAVPMQVEEATQPVPEEVTPAQPAEALSEWLQEMAVTPTTTILSEETLQPSAEEVAPAQPAEALPEWLQEMAVTPTTTILSEEAAQPSAEEVSPAQPAEAIPEWLQEMAGMPDTTILSEEVLQPSAEEMATAQPAEALPEWLQEMAGTPGTTILGEEVLQPSAEEVAPAQPAEALPDWLQEMNDTPSTTILSEEVAQPPESLPDWLKRMAGTPTTTILSEEVAPAKSEEELPEWLQAVVEPAIPIRVESQSYIEAASPQPTTILPEFVTEQEQTANEEELPPFPPKPLSPVEVGGISLSDQEAALAWLESLAAKQGADEELLFVKPEDRLEKPPAWIQDAINQAETTQPMLASEDYRLKEEEIQPPGAITTQQEEIPEWLQENAISSGEPVPGENSQTEVPTAQTTIPPPLEDQPSPKPIEEMPVEKSEIAVVPEQIPEPLILPQPTVSEPVTEDAGIQPSMGTGAKEIRITLEKAQIALNIGEITEAVEIYNQFISNGTNLEDIIHDLRDALYHHPIDVNIWQTLGDAYLHSNRIQDAIDAYTQAEEFIR